MHEIDLYISSCCDSAYVLFVINSILCTFHPSYDNHDIKFAYNFFILQRFKYKYLKFLRNIL